MSNVLEGLGNALANHVPEAPFEDGTEIGFRVIDAERKEGTSQKGRDWEMLNLVLSPEPDDTNPNPKVIYHALWLPNKDDSAQSQNKTVGSIKKCFDAVGYEPAGDVLPEELFGLEGRAVVVLKPEEDGRPAKNEIKFWVRQ